MNNPTPCPTTQINRNWYALRYTAQAPAGLPPVIEADNLFTYTDAEDTWVVAVWENPPNTTGRCILRLPASQVASASRHPDLATAASAAFA